MRWEKGEFGSGVADVVGFVPGAVEMGLTLDEAGEAEIVDLSVNLSDRALGGHYEVGGLGGRG